MVFLWRECQGVDYFGASVFLLCHTCALALQPTRNTTSSGAWRRVSHVPWTCPLIPWRNWNTLRLSIHFATRSVLVWLLPPMHSHPAPTAPISVLIFTLLLGYLLGGCLLPDRPNCVHFGAGRCSAALQARCVSGCPLLRAPSSSGCGCLLWLHGPISSTYLGHWGLCR